MTDTDNVLFVGVDGWDVRLEDYYEHPWWQEHRGEFTEVTIPKPDLIDSGEIATASSPRLWARIYTGCPPYDNGILGFWEYMDEDGEVYALDMPLEWIREERCEKMVTSEHLLVPPVWQLALNAGRSVGLTTPWFTYPLNNEIQGQIDTHGSWALADFPFPRGSPRMDDQRLYYPPAAEPFEDFTEEVGAGARVATMVKDDPGSFYDQLCQADTDRYWYTETALASLGTPDLTVVLTRSTDGAQHQFRKDEDIRDNYPDRLRDGEENMRRIYELNMDGIQSLWEAGDYDHLVIGGDHQTGVDMTPEGPEFKGSDHSWPAKFAILSPDLPNAREVQAKYEDIVPTILDLLDVDPPDHLRGNTLTVAADVQERLEDLGYM